MTKHKLSDYYTTSDLGLASAISLFYPLELIDKTFPSKAKFMFRRNDGLDEVVQAYWKRELQVDPLSYFNQLKAVKVRLYEEDR